MRRSFAVVVVAASAFVGSLGGCDCENPVSRLRPTLVVDPEAAVLNGIPVSQDTPIVFQLPNRRTVNLDDVTAVLSGDPAFTLVDDEEERVLPGEIGALKVVVRPKFEGEFKATLIVDSELGLDDEAKNARPFHVEVPITVNAINVGLPQIEVTPPEVEFATIGRADIGRAFVRIENIGVRDLILDHVYLTEDSDPAFRISVGGISVDSTTPFDLGPHGAKEDIALIFQPTDTERHTGTLVINSNDNDPEADAEIRVPISAQAVECPVAVATLVDEDLQIEPFDTVRLDGRDSFTTAAGTSIATAEDGGYSWSMLVRPIGSTAVLSTESQNRTEFEADLAGQYQVQLDVFAVDSSRPGNPAIRSCTPALVNINVKPSDDLHVQLVWDHPQADLDLHVLNDGGRVFTHEGDCYFSNRRPLAPDTPGPWSGNADLNPRLDVDDDEGYGPENANIKHPAPGSKWTILVHYWNKQTSGIAETTAIVRVFVYGSQAIELEQTFANDQQLWRALELVWGDDELDPPTLSQIGTVEPFLRPF